MNIEIVLLVSQLILLIVLGLKFYRKVILNRVKYKF
jgi:hypothetical protein